MELGTHFVLLPLGSDIRAKDIVTQVKDRRGRAIFGDRLRVVAVDPREDHLEAALEVYR